MILDNVTKFPIVIIAPPRSGSSVICSQIGLDLNIKYFNDVTYSTDKNEMSNFLEFIDKTDQYVVKFHAFDINKYPKRLIDRIFQNETYNVKVVRGNLPLHVASIYTARKRNLYHYDHVNLEYYRSPIEIDRLYIAKCISVVKGNIKELEHIPVEFDKTIIYEDYNYRDDVIIKTPLPSNYNELLEEIKKELACQKEF